MAQRRPRPTPTPRSEPTLPGRPGQSDVSLQPPGRVVRYDIAEQKKIEARFKGLEEANAALTAQNAKLARRSRFDPRIPLLATNFDVEDAIFSNPHGVLAETSSTTLNINTVAETDCLTLAAITGDGVRRVLITVFCWVGGVGGDVLELRIKEGGTILQRQQYRIPVTGGQGQRGLTILWEFVPTSAAHTYKFTVQRTIGSGGNVNALAEANRPAFIMCEDIGT